MTGEGNGLVFEVKLSQKIKERAKELHQETVLRGEGPSFLRALRIIHDRLRRDPTRFGEPLYHLRALKLVMYQAVVSPVVVVYVVHEEKPLVFLRDVKLLD
jgi:hypothetical protein